MRCLRNKTASTFDIYIHTYIYTYILQGVRSSETLQTNSPCVPMLLTWVLYNLIAVRRRTSISHLVETPSIHSFMWHFVPILCRAFDGISSYSSLKICSNVPIRTILRFSGKMFYGIWRCRRDTSTPVSNSFRKPSRLRTSVRVPNIRTHGYSQPLSSYSIYLSTIGSFSETRRTNQERLLRIYTRTTYQVYTTSIRTEADSAADCVVHLQQ